MDNLELINKIVNHEANVAKVLDYIKETYDIDGIAQDNNTIKLVTENQDTLKLALVKEYIEETIGKDMVCVVS
jgi:hypothetical protein